MNKISLLFTLLASFLLLSSLLLPAITEPGAHNKVFHNLNAKKFPLLSHVIIGLDNFPHLGIRPDFQADVSRATLSDIKYFIAKIAQKKGIQLNESAIQLFYGTQQNHIPLCTIGNLADHTPLQRAIAKTEQIFVQQRNKNLHTDRQIWFTLNQNS